MTISGNQVKSKLHNTADTDNKISINAAPRLPDLRFTSISEQIADFKFNTAVDGRSTIEHKPIDLALPVTVCSLSKKFYQQKKLKFDLHFINKVFIEAVL